MRAVALNFRDTVFMEGNAVRAPASGRIPCTDAVGEVIETGAAVTRFKPGDRVNTTVLPNWIDGPLTAQGFAGSIGTRTTDGVLAQQIVFDENAFVRAPAHLSDLEAATLPVAALTAWHAVAELGAISEGDTVVVQTTGGVAVFAMQFALALGARVVVVSRSQEKLERAHELGAHALINSTDTPYWADEVMRITQGKGAELILDMGLAGSMRESCRAAAFEGTVAVIGVVQNLTAEFDIFDVMNKNLRVRGVETGSRAMFERMIGFMEQHAIHPVVESVFGIDKVAGAFRRLKESPFGKVVIDLAVPL